MLSEPFTITASPGRIAAQTASTSSAEDVRHGPRPSPSASVRRGSVMSGPAANTRSILFASIAAASAACSAGPSWPSSFMSPSTAMRRPPRLSSTAPRFDKRRAHGGRIGVVALVDQQRLAVADGQHGALAAPDRRLQLGERERRRGEVGAERVSGRKHAERIQRDVPSGRADPIGERLTEDRAPRRSNRSGFTTIRSARISAASCSPNVTTRPAARCERMRPQALEIGAVAVEHGGAARLDAARRSRPWRRRCPRCDGKNSMCTGSIVVTTATCGRTMRGQRQDLARMVHADLEDAEFGLARHARERQRHAPMIVVGGDRCVRRGPGATARCASPPWCRSCRPSR